MLKSAVCQCSSRSHVRPLYRIRSGLTAQWPFQRPSEAGSWLPPCADVHVHLQMSSRRITYRGRTFMRRYQLLDALHLRCIGITLRRHSGGSSSRHHCPSLRASLSGAGTPCVQFRITAFGFVVAYFAPWTNITGDILNTGHSRQLCRRSDGPSL